MNVTKSNFREACKDFEIALEKSDFVTIDCEFTGVSAEHSKILPYDSPDHAYRKYMENCAGYIIIQLGVTLIQAPAINSSDDAYIYHSYNFYVCPKSWRTNFLCQASSIAFLAENGFDFTKLFCEGVPYCNEQEEKILRERLQEKQKARQEARNITEVANTSFNHIPVPDEEKEAITRIQQEIENFVNSEEDEKVIGGCNAFQRKLIYELIEANFGDKVGATTKSVDNNKVIVVHHRKSEEEEERIEKELQESEMRDLEDSIGISTILQKISISRKPIIGHNLFLDLIYILRQFFKPLPDNLAEFKKFAISIFPNIIDTKCMCNLPKVKPLIKSSILGDIINTIREEPFSLPKLKSGNSNFSYSLQDNKAHEAGYDSYLTAVAFLTIAKFLHESINTLLNDLTEAKDYLNRLFLVKLPDIGYLNLVGVEPVPSRDHVFHVTIPEEWNKSDLINHFRNYGPIFITWINATSALISLHKKENSSSVLKTISPYTGFKVQSFNDYKETLQYRINGNDTSTSSQAKKRKLSGDQSAAEEGSTEKKMKTSTHETEPKGKHAKRTSAKKDLSRHKTKVFAESDDW